MQNGSAFSTGMLKCKNFFWNDTNASKQQVFEAYDLVKIHYLGSDDERKLLVII